jgi:antitoxin component of MazEF toxin-antitoxin module
MSTVEFRKIQGMGDERTFYVGIPKAFISELGVSKGDYVKCTKDGGRIVIEPVLDQAK